MRGLRRESGQVRGPAGKRGRVPGSFEFFMRSGVSRFLAVPGNTFPRGGLVLIGGGGGGRGGGGGGGGVVFVWHVAVFRAMEAAMEDRLRMLFNAR